MISNILLSPRFGDFGLNQAGANKRNYGKGRPLRGILREIVDRVPTEAAVRSLFYPTKYIAKSGTLYTPKAFFSAGTR